MSCDNLNSEDYRLYVIGIADEAETELIRSHVRESCSRCISELREGVEFWYVFALVGAEQSNAYPSKALRGAILDQITDRRQVKWWEFHWGTPQTVAASVTVVMVSALSWYAGDQGFVRRSESKRAKGLGPSNITQLNPPAPQPSDVAPPTTPSSGAQSSEAELRALKLKLAQVEAQLAARHDTGSPAASSAGLVALQKALNDTKDSLRDSQQALSQQEAKTASVERDLQNQRNLLATAVRDRQEADNRARSLAENQPAREERERQVRTLTARVEQLEKENTEFRNALNRQRRQLDQNLQLAGYLSSPTVKMVKLQPTEKSETALGYAFVEGSRVLFVASKLPDLPPGRQYQLWLIRGRGTPIVSGGVFSMAGQRTIIEITDPKLLVDLKALAVTDEPTGGSPLPTGHKYLVSTTRG